MLCTGNDFVVVLSVCDDGLTVVHEHERTFSALYFETLITLPSKCAVDESGTTLLLENTENGRVIEDMMQSVYETCSGSTRDENDTFVLSAFQLYLQKILKAFVDHITLNNQIMHFVLVAPNTWDAAHFPAIQEQFELSGLTKTYDLEHSFMSIHQSDTVIRYFMEPVMDGVVSNGENCVIYNLTRSYTHVYGYEIGKPLRGIPHMSHHSLVRHQDLFSITTEAVKDQIRKCLACDEDMEEVVEYCMRVSSGEEYEEDMYVGHIIGPNKDGSDSNYKIRSMTVKDIWDHLLKTLLAPLKAHGDLYVGAKVMLITSDNDLEGHLVQYLYDRLSESTVLEKSLHVHTETYTYYMGSLRTTQIDLMQSNYVPRIRPIEQPDDKIVPERTTTHHVHIDIQCDKNMVTCNTVDKDHLITRTHSVDMSGFPAFDRSFILHEPIYESTIRDIDITEEYKNKIKSYNKRSLKKKMASFFDKKIKRKKAKEAESVDSSFVWYGMLGTGQVVDDIYREARITKAHIRRLFRMYIECVQTHVQRCLVASRYAAGKCQYILTIEQAILEIFYIRYNDLKNSLVEYYREKNISMKLVRRGHISSIYYKEQLKYYETAEDQFDYPKNVITAHLHPTYIDIKIDEVMPLTENTTSSEDETVIMGDKFTIPFNMVDAMVDALWDDIVSEGPHVALCEEHAGLEYAYIEGSSDQFYAHFRSYLINDYLCSKYNIKWYTNIDIPVSSQCQCRLRICKIDIFDICVKAAINKLFSTVMAALEHNLWYIIYTMNDLIVTGTPIITDKNSPMSMEILAAMKTKFMFNQKYYGTEIHWMEEDMDVVINSAMKTMAVHPECGLCEQIPSGDFLLEIETPTLYYLDSAKTVVFDTTIGYALGDEWVMYSDDLFDERKPYFLYSGAVDQPIIEDDNASRIILRIYLDYKGKRNQVYTTYLQHPRNGYPLVLKHFLIFGYMYFSIDTEVTDYAYLISDNYVHMYENTTLHLI